MYKRQTNDWIGFYPYVECIIAQVIAAIAVIALFVVGFIKQRKAKAKAAVTAGAANGSAEAVTDGSAAKAPAFDADSAAHAKSGE